MSIVFFCHSCDARFEVAPNLAGKHGRCNRCGQRFTIPSTSEVAHAAATSAAPAPKASASTSQSSWIAAVNASNVGLKPITLDRIPVQRIGRPKAADVDDFDDSTPYNLAEPVRPMMRGRASKPVGSAKMLWRRELGGLGKILRWINETAYLLSVPFLMMILIGAILKSHPIAILGATVVVLLNLGRLGVGVANLVVYAFKEGIAQGIFFLIPPLTFIYLYQHWKSLRKPTKRVIEPALTILLVVLAFTFIPSLSRSGRTSGRLTDRVRKEAETLKREIREEVSSKARVIDEATQRQRGSSNAR